MALITTDLVAKIYDGNELIDVVPAARTRCKDEHNGVGYGDIDVYVTDPIVSQLTAGRHLRFYLKEVHAFTAIVSDREKIQASTEEEAGAKVTVGGPGIAQRLDEGCLLPYGGIGHRPFGDTRSYSWASPEYDCSSWPNVYVQFDQAHRMITDGILGNGDEAIAWWANAGDPQFYEPWWPSRGWTWFASKWVWSANVGVYYVPGKSLFAKNITIPSNRVVTMFTISSRRARIFVDGLLAADWPVQAPVDRRLDVHYMTIPMTAGVHKIGVEVEIWPEAPFPYYGTLMACIHTESGTGVYNDSTLIACTDETWNTLHLPSLYPAPTPHTIMATALAENQAENMCSGITLTSTPTLTSAGTPWNPPSEQVFQLGVSPLSMVKALDVDWAMSPQGDVLHLWNPGERGVQVPEAVIGVGMNAESLRRKETS